MAVVALLDGAGPPLIPFPGGGGTPVGTLPGCGATPVRIFPGGGIPVGNFPGGCGGPPTGTFPGGGGGGTPIKPPFIIGGAPPKTPLLGGGGNPVVAAVAILLVNGLINGGLSFPRLDERAEDFVVAEPLPGGGGGIMLGTDVDTGSFPRGGWVCAMLAAALLAFPSRAPRSLKIFDDNEGFPPPEPEDEFVLKSPRIFEANAGMLGTFV